MQARIILWLIGSAFIGFGVWALVAPISFSGLIQFGLTSALATTELRAFYGGLELGLGAFFIFCAIRHEITQAGLLLGVFVLTSVAVARMFGLVVDSSSNPLLLGVLGSEIIGATACVWALRFQK